MIKITFSKNPKTKRFILSLFGKDVDSENYIIEKETGERVLSSNGQEITFKRFGGVVSGSEIFLKDDFVSLVDYYENRLSKQEG